MGVLLPRGREPASWKHTGSLLFSEKCAAHCLTISSDAGTGSPLESQAGE